MSGFSGGSKTISTETPRIGALRINSSAYGLAIPLLWGTNRLSGNLIWYGDFKAIAHTTTEKTGGKGGGGGTKFKSTTYTYRCAFAFGLASGEIEGIGTVWSGKEKSTTSALGLTVFTGDIDQAPWSYLTSKHADEALAYPGLAYVAASAFDLGDTAYLPNFSFEVKGPRIIGQIMPGVVIPDAMPDDFVVDYLTSPLSGAGFPAQHLGDLQNWRTYCIASSFFISPAITEQAPAADHLRDVCQMTNTEMVWSEDKLKFVPYGDAEITGNGATWVPDIVPLFDLTDDDFLVESGQDPVTQRGKTSADKYNMVQVEFVNRDLEYNTDLGLAKDPTSIGHVGLRKRDPIRMPWITNRTMADRVADLIMRRDLYIGSEYEFRLGVQYSMLEPMDVVSLTHAPLGLSFTPVRIVSIDDSPSGELTVVAEEMPWAVSTPAKIPTQDAGGAVIDFNVAPGNANTPVIFEPPMSLSGGPELWMATSGSTNWGGAEVWVSLDDQTYSRMGTITAPARHGVLFASLADGGDPDLTSIASVDLGVSRGTLLAGTQEDRDLYQTLCWVEGELISYENADLVGSYRYDLQSLRRGAYGTPRGIHATNSRFVRIDTAVYRQALDPALVGHTLYVKLRSFNIYGGALQDLADLTPTTYEVEGAPVGSVGGLFPEQPFVGRSAKISWSALPGADGYRVEVWAATQLQRSVDTTETRFEYTFEDAISDGGPWRTLQFKVYALTPTGVSETPALLQLTNPQIAAPTAVSVSAVLEGLSVSCAMPTDTDYGGCRVWVSTTTGFDPSLTMPVYDGIPTSFTHYGLDAGISYYVRIGCYDVFGTDGMQLSSELEVEPRGIPVGPEQMLEEINALLTDEGGTDRIVMIADRFAIQSPGGEKYPFAVVDVGGGDYKILLDGDVLIGGNVDIANLKTGTLPSDVIMRLGGGTIELDGAGEIRVYKDVGPNQDFVRLTSGQIHFIRYIAGVGYVPYNYLSRVESGVATNNDVVTIPGYFSSEPRIAVFPASIGSYSAAYSGQSQTLVCQATEISETSPGSMRYQFRALANLAIAAGSGLTAINVSSGDLTATTTWNSGNYSTPANCTSITPSVNLTSMRWLGSATNYQRRQVQWRVRYSGDGGGGSWRVKDIGPTLAAVTDSYTFNFPSAGTYSFWLEFQASDVAGTFVPGSPTYETSQDSRSSSGVYKNQSGNNWTGGATMPAYSAPAGWVIASVNWSYNGVYNYLSAQYTLTYPDRTVTNHPVFVDVNFTGGGTAASYSTSWPTWSLVTSGGGTASIKDFISSATATINLRRYQGYSASGQNRFDFLSYNYALAANSVLATGTLNWQAIGD